MHDLSILRLSSAMARHAAQVHQIVGQNIARSNIPGATQIQASSFNEYVQAASRGASIEPRESRDAISLDREMVTMAANAGRHEAATMVWAKTIDLVRLAGSAPR